MKITNTDGLDIISIGLSDIASYFRLYKPASLIWADCRGSIGQYMCLLPLKEEERVVLHNKITEGLTDNFSYKEELLYDLLKPLFSLLSKGEYVFGYNDGYSQGYYELNGQEYEPNWSLYFSEPVKLEDISIIKKDHSKKGQSLLSTEYLPDLLDFTTTGIYNWQDEFFVATRPESEIDLERVAYFEKQILNGERPFAIILSAMYGDTYSEDFVLDGHHKLLAYKNLDLNPPLVKIKRLYKTLSEIEFDLNKLEELLYPWQFEHLKRNNDLLEEISGIENYWNYYNRPIQNGEYKEFYDNRQLKFKATYKNGIPDGPMREWYPNGRLKYKYHYRNGIRVKLWRDWYDSGRLRKSYRFNEQGQYQGIKTKYSDKGRLIFWENWINGIHADGIAWETESSPNYYSKQTYYKDGRATEIKYYSNGRLSAHRKYSIEERKFISIPVPEPEPPSYVSNPTNQTYYKQIDKRKKEDRLIQIGCMGIIIFILFAFFLFLKSLLPDGKKPLKRKNSYYETEERNRSVLDKRTFEKEEQLINSLNFEEARQFPLNDPPKSLNAAIFFPDKYVNPFLSPLFQRSNDDILTTDTSLIVNNKTDKEMVLIAWYRKAYDKDSKRYTRIIFNQASQMYALYIPPRDEIKVDFQMNRFLLYTGNGMKQFNSYPYHNYDDSLDYKFSHTSIADSVLLKTNFYVNDNNSLKEPIQRLSIEQLGPDKYVLTWNAKMRLYARELSQIENGKTIIHETINPDNKHLIYAGKTLPTIDNYDDTPIEIVDRGFQEGWKQDKILDTFFKNLLYLNEMYAKGELFYRKSLINNSIYLIKIVRNNDRNVYYMIDKSTKKVRKVYPRSIKSD